MANAYESNEERRLRAGMGSLQGRLGAQSGGLGNLANLLNSQTAGRNTSLEALKSRMEGERGKYGAQVFHDDTLFNRQQAYHDAQQRAPIEAASRMLQGINTLGGQGYTRQEENRNPESGLLDHASNLFQVFRLFGGG